MSTVKVPRCPTRLRRRDCAVYRRASATRGGARLRASNGESRRHRRGDYTKIGRVRRNEAPCGQVRLGMRRAAKKHPTVALALGRILRERAHALERWLVSACPQCEREQLHLDQGSAERACCTTGICRGEQRACPDQQQEPLALTENGAARALHSLRAGGAGCASDAQILTASLGASLRIRGNVRKLVVCPPNAAVGRSRCAAARQDTQADRTRRGVTVSHRRHPMCRPAAVAPP